MQGFEDNHRSKYSTVAVKPSFSAILGSHCSFLRASEISGCRRTGSSCGMARQTIRDREPVIDSTISDSAISANSRMVNSAGLPMLTGLPAYSDIAKSSVGHRARVEKVTTIHEYRNMHRTNERRKRKRLVLLPLGSQHDGICTLEYLIRSLLET